MNWRQLVKRIVGFYYVAYGTLFLYFSYAIMGKIITEGTDGLLPTFGGNSFDVVSLVILIVPLLVIPAGIMLLWKSKRWAAIVGIIGTLVLPLTSFTLKILISVSGGTPLTEQISADEIYGGIGFFFLLPTLGMFFTWKDLQ